MSARRVPENIYRLAASTTPDPAFTIAELLDRPDAAETFARIAAVTDSELITTLTALAALRARAAAERSGR